MIRRRNRTILIALVAVAIVAAVLIRVLVGVEPYVAWLAGWSVATFAAYGIDKAQARRGGWRIPEVGLHGLALAGGAIGGWLGMFGFRHKTRQPAFIGILALASVLQVVLAVVLLR